MNASTKLLLAGTAPALILFSLAGSAQDEAGVDDLSRVVHSQDLDSYWSDQAMWTEFGYRPHVQAQTTPFTSLPSYFAGKNYYSFGTDLSSPNIDNPLDKTTIQQSPNGTWH
jgi:hypothetical protein